jgi:hypothetical protein
MKLKIIMRKKKPESFKPLDQSKKIAVIIDSRTTIYVKEGTDPEAARQNFIEKYNYGK